METLNINELVATNLVLIPYIKTQQNSLRLLGLVPDWSAFLETEQYMEWRKEGMTGAERRKYRAMWDLIQRLPRDKNDYHTVALAMGFLLQETETRRNKHVTPIYLAEFGFTSHEDLMHCNTVREYIRTHYENLIPSGNR